PGGTADTGMRTAAEFAADVKNLQACAVSVLFDCCNAKSMKDAMFDALTVRKDLVPNDPGELVVGWACESGDRAAMDDGGSHWIDLVTKAWQDAKADEAANGG